MNDYSHITEMENILNEYDDKINKMQELLDFFNNNMENYNKLIEYYYSEKRNQDLIDDEKNLIPQDLKRGVLSEDGIYNMLTSHDSLAIEMLETATKMLKK